MSEKEVVKKKSQFSTGYRPVKVSEVIGNEAAKKEVADFLRDRDSHAILFHGPSGCGKTTLARIVANAVVGRHKQDLFEANIGAATGIDALREIIANAQYLPTGDMKVLLLEECHAFTGQAKSALLRPLEDPPHDKILWLLVTDRPWMLDQQILNRCRKIEVKPPSVEQLSDLLLNVMEDHKEFRRIRKEKTKARIAKEIARAVNCVPREALQVLQSVKSDIGRISSIDELIVTSIRKTSNEVDTRALGAIMALYSNKKSAQFRAEFLVDKFGGSDVFGILNRMQYVNHVLFMNAGGVRMPAMYYFEKELKDKGAIPSLAAATRVSNAMADIKKSLKEINMDPAYLVVPRLVSLILDTGGSNDDAGNDDD